MNNKDLLNKVTTYPYKSSELWVNFMLHLKSYLQTDDLELYRINNIQPHIFTWPEESKQNMKVLEILESQPESIFYKVIQKSNPKMLNYIKMYNSTVFNKHGAFLC